MGKEVAGKPAENRYGRNYEDKQYASVKCFESARSFFSSEIMYDIIMSNLSYIKSKLHV